MINKIKELKSIWYNTIDVTFNLTYICNFICAYCIAWEKNNRTFQLNKETKNRLRYLIESIHKVEPDVKINFLLAGWEPLINKEFIEIVEFLLSFNNVVIEVTTNGFYILDLEEKIISLNNKNFSFYMTLHYQEYIKFDKIWIRYVNTIKQLRLNNVKFKLNFLIPYDKSVFEDFRRIMNYIINKSSLLKNEYEINLIRENWSVSKKYSKEALEYYYIEKPKIITNVPGEEISIDFIDGSNKEISYIKEIIECWLNNFKGYLCYPFSIPTNILLEPDLSMSFASCSTMLNKKYSIDEWINLIKNWDNTTVICNTDFCECWANLWIKKKFNKEIFNSFTDINNFINDKVGKLLIIDWLFLRELRMIFDINKKTFLVSYYNLKQKDIFINFVVEKKETNSDYAIEFWDFWIHYYKINFQWWMVDEYIHWLDDNIEIILLKIKSITPILSSLIKKYY